MQIEQIIANKAGWFTPAESAAFYGRPRTLEEIVLHHWNSPAARPSFNGNLQYLLNPPGGVPTANTVIGFDETQNRVRIVDTVTYPNVAFTSSGAVLKNARAKYINCVSVGIEIDPLIEVVGHAQRAAIIKAVAYRCFQYWLTAGRKIPLTGHNTYVATACPGAMPFSEILAETDRLWNAHHAPKPTPAPTKPKITYKAVEKRVWLTNLEPTKLWNLDFNTYPEAKEVARYSKGHPVTVVGLATHPLGSEYFMTEYALGTADPAKINAAGFVPKLNQGFNKKDMVQAPDPVPVPPVTPPTPPVTPPPVTPPKPEPQPTDYDKKQDAEISAIKGTLNSLIAVLREFAKSIINKFGA